jgi:hypothetical protein
MLGLSEKMGFIRYVQAHPISIMGGPNTAGSRWSWDVDV